MWLFGLFLAIPLIEIALFIQIGGLIGLWPTLAVVVITAIIGTTLVRAQGAMAMSQLRGSLNELRDPTEPLAHGAMILVAGVLLLTPGFFTDACGFALLVPPIRAAVFRYVKSRVTVAQFEYGQQTHTQRPGTGPHGANGPGDVIDGDYQDLSSDKRPTHGPSGWTRH